MSIFVDNQCYTVLNDILDSSKKLRKETQIQKSQKGLCEKSDENSFLVFSFLKFFNLDGLVRSPIFPPLVGGINPPKAD